MDSTTTRAIVDALTKAIVEHRLQPGTKLAEQKLADHFGVSRTLVRQALFQLSQNNLIRLEPARGAFVAAPTVDEARQVFAVRRMLEAEMTRAFVRSVTPAKIKALQEHVALEKAACRRDDTSGRTELLGDFHVRMAELMGNAVLAQILRRPDLALLADHADVPERQPRPSIRTTSTPTSSRPWPPRTRNAPCALMTEHLEHVEANLTFDRKVPTHDISLALA